MGKFPSRAMPGPRSFRSSKELRAWMAKEHTRAPGLLLRIYKKDSGVPSVTYAEALDQALCFGWIDGQKLPFDANSWVQKFTPRRARNSTDCPGACFKALQFPTSASMTAFPNLLSLGAAADRPTGRKRQFADRDRSAAAGHDRSFTAGCSFRESGRSKPLAA